MSHVDEGALHAYLDGALDEYPSAEAETIRTHLDACAECAERLEAERRIRSDAHALLGLAAPEVEVPSFEELRAYVQRTRRQRRGISRLQRLGWAASIVVALGAGWMLREGQLHDRALDIGRQEAPSRATEPVSEGAGASGANAPAADGVDTEEHEVSQLDAAEREVSQLDAAEREVSQLDAAPTPTEASHQRAYDEEAASPDVSAPSPETVDVVADAPARSSAVGVPAETGAVPAEPAAVPAETVGVSAQMVEVPSDAVAVLADSARIAEETEQARMDDTAGAAANAEASAGRKAPPPMPASDSAPEPVLALDAVIVAAETVRAAEASGADAGPAVPVTSTYGVTRREALGDMERRVPNDSVPADPLLAVPGHEVLDVVNLGDGTTSWGVRVRQRTDDGRVFEVFHLEAGIDPSILPDEGDGAGEVRTETDLGWVLIRGPLSERELAELLGSLFPGDS